MCHSIQIVVPVFDRHQHIAPLLSSLARQTLQPSRVVIVDHGLTNLNITDTCGLVVDVIKRPSSMWFTAATNEGLKHAIQHESDFLMILNDDVSIPSQTWLKNLADLANRENAIAASSAASVSGSSYYTAIILRGLRFRYEAVGRGQDHQRSPEATVECDVLPTRGIIFRPQVLNQIGLLDESLPHHGSDYEWTARAKRAGNRLLMNNRIWLITDCEPVRQSPKTIVDEVRHYLNSSHFKGSFPVASAYSKRVFTPWYRFGFLSVHMTRFFLRTIFRRVFPRGQSSVESS